MKHLNVRVAWHDNKWNGTVCRDPVGNSFCVDLERIREERNELNEVKWAGKRFSELESIDLPPCKAESAAFMNDAEWIRTVNHPYATSAKTQETHGHLQETHIRVPPFSTFAVPFYWMLRQHQEELDARLPTPMPPDEDPPFESAWVFSSERQQAIGEYFFGQIEAGKSLAFFYTKSGHPLEEAYSRLVVGVGTIDQLSPTILYNTQQKGHSYPLWDRVFQHSIRPEGKLGFLLPYHDYLESTGDPEEDVRRRGLLNEIAVVPEAVDVMSFSYAGELSTSDVALSVLVKCLSSVRKIREHGIAKGPWAEREEWLNEQIAEAWKARGAFPGAGSVLEALGLRLGTSLIQELMAKAVVDSMADPWPTLDLLLLGKKKPPQVAYKADLEACRATWVGLTDERRALLKLLSRMSISSIQAKRWFDPRERAKAVRQMVSDEEILANPYRIAEVDLGDQNEYPVNIATVERGIMPDDTVSKAHPLEPMSRVDSPMDPRRIRAALVVVLRNAADNGDSLLSEVDAVMGLAELDLPRPCIMPADWLVGNEAALAPEIERINIELDAQNGESLPCVQLSELKQREQKLGKLMLARADKQLASLKESWQQLLIKSIEESGGRVDASDQRHADALIEQANALENLTSRKLSVLVGRAGTGKTTVLGALLKSKSLSAGGVLFLAPTGKARVRLGQKANANAMTVAQFLYHLKRYDGVRQRPRFKGDDTYRKEKTVVIDECSMLTMDDLLATLLALDLAHVERVILVGDPNQLPPIGVGRPFADLVAYLDECSDQKMSIGASLARLTVELRNAAGGPSDTLRLASWFTREQQPADADKVLSDIESGAMLNDLVVCNWQNPSELRSQLEKQFVKQLGLSNPSDIKGFNKALGLTDEGWVPFDNHNGAERFQILSPVRLHTHGVHDINRWIQQRFRGDQLNASRRPYGLSLGDEEIVWGDKVILNRNGKRDGWNGKTKQKVEDYLANGEIGVACPAQGGGKNKYLQVALAGRSDVRFSFSKWDFSGGSGPLELAYALTVHKAQGSEFGIVFAVIPKASRFLSRELLYTALTRSKLKLILLVEGNDPTVLYELSKPSNSETARRNTNLFAPGVRRDADDFRYAAHLVHRTTRGIMVQSKSELAIANFCDTQELPPYQYNRPLEGPKTGGKLRPDFTFVSDAGELVLWEHLGMLDRADYKRSWDWKKAWYKENGFVEGVNLFTTTEGPGLDMHAVEETSQEVKSALAKL
jgi:ATP-dependent exoDNAse (exonuclease V) alpha subunit